jgi:signal peptidase II
MKAGRKSSVKIGKIDFKKWTVTSLIVLFLIVFDQVMKEVAIFYLRGQPLQSFFGDVFRLQYAENKGAFLSLGSNLSGPSRFWILGVIVLVFLSLYAYQLLKGSPTKLVVFGISFVMGGGVSNLLDRFFRAEGSVIDFMNMGIGNLRTGIFNVADMAIVVGVSLLFYDSWQIKRQEKKA